jgi:hypothetical protein
VLEKKIRRMKATSLNDGSIKTETVNVPCTVYQYIRSINRLNESASVYGVVYTPFDEEYDALIVQHCGG